MARGLLIRTALVALLVAISTSSPAQTTGRRSSGSTLAERLSQLKSVFVRDHSGKDEDQGHYSGRSSGSHSSSNQDNGRYANRSSSSGRVKAGDLLPKGIFDRNADPGHRGNEYEQAEAFEPSPRPNDSNSGGSDSLVKPRRSPNTTRENELQEALADILATDIEGAENEIQSPGSEEFSDAQPSSRESNASQVNEGRHLDLRQALINKSKSVDSSRSVARKNTHLRSNSAEAVEDLRQQFEALAEPELTLNSAKSSSSHGDVLGSLPQDREAERAFDGPKNHVSPSMRANAPHKTASASDRKESYAFLQSTSSDRLESRRAPTDSRWSRSDIPSYIRKLQQCDGSRIDRGDSCPRRGRNH